MRSGVMQQIDAGSRQMIPLALGLGGVLVMCMPYGLPHLARVMPALGLMTVYYWAIRRPAAMPPVAAFVIGLWQDALTGGPLGLMALIFLLLRGFIVTQRPVFVGKAFLVDWWGLALVSSAGLAGGWALAGVYFGTVFEIRDLIVQILLTVALYPVLARLFHHLLRAVPDGN